MTLVSLSTTRSRAATSPSVWTLPESTRSPKPLSTPSRPTTATWSPTPSRHALFRPPTQSLLPAPVPAARTSKTTSSVLKSWKKSPRASPALPVPTPFRPAAKSALWSSPKRSTRIRWSCSPETSQRRSRKSLSIPVRSRCICCARPRPQITRSKISKRHDG